MIQLLFRTRTCYWRILRKDSETVLRAFNFLVASYNYEVHERAARNLNAKALNVNQMHYICQALLHSDLFYHHTPLRRRMTALILPEGTGKMQNIISLIAGTYYVLHASQSMGLSFKIRQSNTTVDECHRRRRRNPNTNLNSTVRQAQLPKTILFDPTNNVVDVLEERIKQGLPMFDERTNHWVTNSPNYRRIASEHDTLFRGSLRSTWYDLLQHSCKQPFHDGITVCTFGSVHRTYTF